MAVVSLERGRQNNTFTAASTRPDMAFTTNRERVVMKLDRVDMSDAMVWSVLCRTIQTLRRL